MDKYAKEAAKIMREWKPKTMGELFGIARGKTVAKGEEMTLFLCEKDDDENGYAWKIVDTHYANLRNSEYRTLAGLGPNV